MRPSPRDIQILLPVWGERYTRDFLELGLPSLVAPRNIPALAQLGSCTFVLLAPARDAGTIEQHPLWTLLQQQCDVSVTFIDNLVSQSSSAVLTLAYALAIRTSGLRALETCFVPLVADYVFSDGALFAAVTRVVNGASAVLVGNFMVAREAAGPVLSKLKRVDGVLVIAPRDFVDISLKSLHQSTSDDLVVEGRPPRAAANRLFWEVDDDCMIGRFYLMHMIAVHPETTDFTISAPSDYSLVSELCPSGKIDRLTDSDEYFVVECQPQLGLETSSERVSPSAFAGELATWATAMHHANVRHPVVFHAQAIPASVADAVVLSERFLTEIGPAEISGLPYRNHPMWTALLDYHIATAQAEQDPACLCAITGDGALMQRVKRAGRLRSLLLGRAPRFRPWHPRWKDVLVLKGAILALRGKVAIVSDASARVRAWFDAEITKGGAGSITHIRPASTAGSDHRQARDLAAYDAVVFCLDRIPADIASRIAQLEPLVRNNGYLILSIGPVFSESGPEATSPLRVSDEFDKLPASLEKMSAIGVAWNPLCSAVQGAMLRHARKAVRSQVLVATGRLALAAGLAIASASFNVVLVGRRGAAGGLAFSSLLLTFRKTETGSERGGDAERGYRKQHSYEIGR